ncbi:long chain fatty acid transporter [Legionella beliardensis]|uniref:Long chain fatty acid transporter n=1 Tax=Legionella beliardensis TaxID=91822 RepID=A0A378I2X1_9GAMM|nr:outer membrane protein transport protein [Legionella beliardensis]STX29508.1 long chain fatty acid transporter [Legionella beliardensis]
MQKPIKTILSAAIVAILANNANAGSFSLYTESSAVAVGNYGAGIAAEAADAATGWYNPAGLSLIHDLQALTGGVGIFVSSKITGTSNFFTSSVPVPALRNYTQTFHDLNGGDDGFVPFFHAAIPLGENVTAGLTMNGPFGLATNWSRTSPVRYQATYSELISTNIAPEIGGRITENLALGLGIDLQYSRVKLNRVLGSPAFGQLPVPGLSPMILDSYSYNKGDSFGVGFHAGAMLLLNDNHSRLGLNYQSRVHHKFHGWSRLTGPLARQTPTVTPTSAIAANLAGSDAVFWSNDLSSNNIEYPDIVTLSGYHDVNESFALLGSVVYTNWHVLRSIQFNKVAGFAPGVGQANLFAESVTDYRNTWRAALGANYRVNSQWLIRAGGGYDQTPTVDEFRDIRIPDTDRWALSVGAHYQYNPNIGVDAGYTHLFGAHDDTINRTDVAGAGSTYTVNARAKGHADLVALQAVWTMDSVEPVPTK